MDRVNIKSLKHNLTNYEYDLLCRQNRKDVVLFRGIQCRLSHFYLASFMHRNVAYVSSEQAYQAFKARFHKDEDSYNCSLLSVYVNKSEIN